MITPDEQSRAWATRLVSALVGAMVLWTYLEPAFVVAGAAWRELGGGYLSYLLGNAVLIAAAPLAAYEASRRFGGANPKESARWASWAAAILLLYHWVMADVFTQEFAAYRDFGFAQFCNNGAWTGTFAGFFGGFAFEPGRLPAPKRTAWPKRLRNAVAAGALIGLVWALIGALLEFSCRKLAFDVDAHLYLTLFLLLGLPFFCGGLAAALRDERGPLAAAWAVPPTFLALYLVLGGASALVDPSQADGLIGRLPEIGLAQGMAAGLLAGQGYRPR